jgi:hypothetical protein
MILDVLSELLALTLRHQVNDQRSSTAVYPIWTVFVSRSHAYPMYFHCDLS